MIAALLLLFQAGVPSIGDTVWVERDIGPVAGAVVRPQSWNLGALGQQLAPATVQLRRSSAVVRYALVLWYPGEHVLTMPGPVLVRRDGRSDTLAAARVRVTLASVLPGGADRSSLDPRPLSVPLPLEARAIVPVVALVSLVLLALGLVALRWRRRGRPAAPRLAERNPPPPEALLGWARTGEYRAALHEWAWILAERLMKSQDLEETGRLQNLLDEISLNSFSPRSPAALTALCERAARMAMP